MHEMGVVLNIIRNAEQAAAANSVKKIARLTLEVGGLTGVIPSYIRACWPAAIENTILEGAELVIEEIDGIGKCRDCDKKYPILENMESDHAVCPQCGSKRWDVKTGRDVMIKDISVIDVENN